MFSLFNSFCIVTGLLLAFVQLAAYHYAVKHHNFPLAWLIVLLTVFEFAFAFFS